MDPIPKAWWQSKTIISALVGAVVALAAVFGHVDLRDQQGQIVDAIMAALSIASTVGVIYGRVVASRPITIKKAIAVNEPVIPPKTR